MFFSVEGGTLMPDYVFGNQYGVLTVQDKATLNEPKSIRFITPEYKEIFRIPDGGQILVNYADGKREAFTCKYLDDYHLLVGYRTFHICEFAETMQRIGAHIEPFPEKHVIWSNRDLDLEDWRETLEENYPEMDDYGLTDMMYQANDDNLPDERANLDIQVGGDILAVADLGRWDGRVIGYKLIESGNIKDCLYTNCEFCEWYVDRDGEFRCDESHHDGTNHIYYRKFREGVTEEQKEDLLADIYDHKAKQEDIDRLTDKLGEAIGKVYGWNFPTPKDKDRDRNGR